MPDIISQIYPWRHLAIEIWKNGQIPLWNPYAFSGTPLLANYQSAVLSPFNILFFIFDFVDSWTILVLIQPLLAGTFMYLFVNSLKKQKISSLIASISFMFCGFITVWMGYATLAYAILFLPLALFAIEEYIKRKGIIYLFYLSFSVLLSFLSGHFQTSFYFLVFVVGYIFYKLLFFRNIKSTVFLTFSVLFGFLMSMPQIIPSIEYYLQSFRSTSFSVGEGIPWGYLPTFLAPDFFGNPITRNDWFGYYAEWNGYIGVLPLMLAFYKIFNSKNKIRIILVSTIATILLLAFSGPISDFIINLHLPIISTTSPNRIIVLLSFLLILLSAFGFDQLIKDIRDKRINKISVWLLFFLLIFLFLWVDVILKIFIPQDKAVIAKNNLILPSLIFLISSSLILLAKFNKKIFFILPSILLLIVAFDMFRFTTKWQPFAPKELVFPNTETTMEFSKISDSGRIIANFGAEGSTYYKLPSLEGYDSLYIKRYGELISSLDGEGENRLYRSAVTFPRNGLYSSKAIDLLNVKYIIHKIEDDKKPWAFPIENYPKGQFDLIYKDNAFKIYKNTYAFPSAFLVGQYQVIKNSDQIINKMFDENFDLGKEVILENDPGIKNEVAKGNVEIKKYSSQEIDVEVNSENDGLLFISDNYYPGWKAIIDGKDEQILRADYAFRAVKVESGNHLVKFIYDPISFRIGIYIFVMGLVGLILVAIYSRKLNPSR